MEEKNAIKISLSTLLLILAIIIIIVMGGIIFKLSKEKTTSSLYTNNNTEIKSMALSNNNNSQENYQEDEEIIGNAKVNSSYNENFYNTVYEKMDDNTTIIVPIWGYFNFSNISINKKHEAYWDNIGNDSFPETSKVKVADNVVNAWYCPLGQDIQSNACLLFLKEDGSITYLRFYLDKDSNGNDFVNYTKELTLKEVSNISNIVLVESGFYGVMFIKEDGTNMNLSLTALDELTRPNNY